MNYLIPAWSTDLKTWAIARRSTNRKLEFDDTINQARMFNQVGVATTLLVPVYFPSYRHFALRQQLTGVPVVNLFDYLQGIPEDLPSQPLDPRNFAWPTDADFVYTPEKVLVYRQGRQSARLNFGQEGNLLTIEKFDAEAQLTTILWLDDRGFLSRVDDYQAGELVQVNYLDVAGKVQLQIKADGSVTFLGAGRLGVKQENFPSLTALMTTLFKRYLHTYVQKTDRLILAFALGINQTLGSLIAPHQLVVSLFGDRAPVSIGLPLAKKARLTLVDQDALKQALADAGAQHILEIPPFDTRLGLGISNQQKGLEIFCLVDGLSDADVTKVLEQVLPIIIANPLVEFTCASYHYQDYTVKARLQSMLMTVQANHDWQVKFTFEASKNDGENQLTPTPKQRYLSFKFLNSENTVIQDLQPVRLILNLGPTPDLFLQIAAISAGIPQVLTVPSQYVEAGKNGQIVNDLTTLPQVINYYLGGLRHWNEALMYTANQIKKYTGPTIVKQILAAISDDFPGNEKEGT